jgi:serine/threonine protein kinase/Flp pilus assembly protein TadD
MKASSQTQSESFISRVISTWRGGRRPDAKHVLSQHPDLQEQKSMVLDLAYEEYCLRMEAGEQIAASTFCDRFPTFRRSLRRLIDVHQQFDQNSQEFGFEASEIRWPEPGESLLDFELLQEIGRGSLARVYLATEPSLGGRRVVLKVSPHSCNEANTLGKLTHRNIVDIHWASNKDGAELSVICMPYLGNATLHDVLDLGFADDQPPTSSNVILAAAGRGVALEGIPKEYVEADSRLRNNQYIDGVVYVMMQLADALSHAHDQGIYHHDLKPSNVLLSPSGCPLLLDFNLSEDTHIGATMFGGTLPYMPPEQLQKVILGPAAEAKRVDASWDVYSLGAILYEMLTGVLPFGAFAGGAPEHVVAAELVELQQEGYQPARLKNPAVSIQLDRLIERCLNPDPSQRPQTAEELATELRVQLTPIQRAKRWLYRRRRWVAVSLVMLMLVAGAIAGVLSLRAPREVRSYEAGVRALSQGRLEQAVGYFSDAHSAAPTLLEPVMARAQVLAAEGRYGEASRDFKKVCDAQPTGLAYAWLAYCEQRSTKTHAARGNYQKAIENGYADSVVFNNLGNSYFQRGALSRAIEYYDQAIACDAECQTAYLNRALANDCLAINHVEEREAYAEKALADVTAAMDSGSANARVFFTAARLHAKYSNSSNVQSIVVNLLEEAIRSGYDPAKIRRADELKPYLRSFEFPKQTEASRNTSASTDDYLLVPPSYFPSLRMAASKPIDAQ